MTIWRPTSLQLVGDHCARALDFSEQDVPYDGTIFATGTAAHSILHACGELARKLRREPSIPECEDVARAICSALIGTGRTEDWQREPPISPDAAWAGRDLAIEYLFYGGTLSPTAHYEIGLALDANGNACDYRAPEAALRCILDVLDAGEELDEESSFQTLIVRDYKSAWSTGPDELTTLQRKAQAVAAVRHFGGGADLLRLEVVNLRTRKTFSETVHLAEERQVIDGWWSDLVTTMKAVDSERDNQGRRIASPGGNCMGCPYVLHCEAAREWLDRSGLPGTAVERARAFAVAKARVEFLQEYVKADTDEAPIPVDDKHVVGTVAKETAALKDDAYSTMAAEWELAGGDLAGFASALDLKVRNAEELAKVLFRERGDRAERDRWTDSLIEPRIDRKFGVHRNPPKPQPPLDELLQQSIDAAETTKAARRTA